MSLPLFGAILLVVVVFRTWATGAKWYDALIAILLGVVIANAGDGFLSTSFEWLADAIRNGFGFLAKLLK
ncbi:hypothetical protein [Micromonospora sp. WMMD737]|uniref:hypothetical protein n=1 Tax=Micromonospora sp. WMMD737 TaxID=3404113 RepID=UPI003B93C0C6